MGCYDETRYESRGQMLAEVYEVYAPPPFT